MEWVEWRRAHRLAPRQACEEIGRALSAREIRDRSFSYIICSGLAPYLFPTFFDLQPISTVHTYHIRI